MLTTTGRDRFGGAAERIAVAVHRAHEPRLAGAVGECSPELVDQRAQARIGDECPGPQARVQIILALCKRSILDERHQQVERFWRQMYRVVLQQKLTRAGIERKSVKVELHGVWDESFDSS